MQNTPKTMSIFFSPPPLGTRGIYAVFPDNIGSDLRVAGGCAGGASEKFASIEELRTSLRQEISKYPEYDCLSAGINLLFYAYYPLLFKNLVLLRAAIQANEITHVDIPGAIDLAYSCVTSRGVEGRRILYFPEILFPRYVAPTLTAFGCTVQMRQSIHLPLKRIIGRMRHWLILAIKLFFVLASTFRRCRAHRTTGQHFDLVLVARGLAPIEHFALLASSLSDKSARVAVFYDPSVYQFWKREPRHYFEQNLKVSFIAADSYATFWRLIRALRRSLSRIPSRMPAAICAAGIEIAEDFAPIAKELRANSLDLFFHLEKLDGFLRDNSTTAVISGELVSPYIFLQSKLTKSHGIKFYTYQTIAADSEAVADLVVGDGLIVQSESAKDEFSKVFPERKEFIHYFGALNFRHETQRHAPRLNRVIFFTQPVDRELSLRIIDSAFNAARKINPDVDFVIKMHPRDTEVDAYRAFQGARLLCSGKIPNRVLLEQADLVLSMSSSILSDALMLGIPYLACTFSQFHWETSAPYMNPELRVCVCDEDELTERILNYERYAQDFLSRRGSFIQRNYKAFDANDFLRNVCS